MVAMKLCGAILLALFPASFATLIDNVDAVTLPASRQAMVSKAVIAAADSGSHHLAVPPTSPNPSWSPEGLKTVTVVASPQNHKIESIVVTVTVTPTSTSSSPCSEGPKTVTVTVSQGSETKPSVVTVTVTSGSSTGNGTTAAGSQPTYVGGSKLHCEAKDKQGNPYVAGLLFFSDDNCEKPLKTSLNQIGHCVYSPPPKDPSSNIDWDRRDQNYGHTCQSGVWPELTGNRQMWVKVDNPEPLYKDSRLAITADKARCSEQSPGKSLTVVGPNPKACTFVGINAGHDIGLTVWPQHGAAKERAIRTLAEGGDKKEIHNIMKKKFEDAKKNGGVWCNKIRELGRVMENLTTTYPFKLTPATLGCSSTDCSQAYIQKQGYTFSHKKEHSFGISGDIGSVPLTGPLMGKIGVNADVTMGHEHSFDLEARSESRFEVRKNQRGYIAATADAQLVQVKYEGCKARWNKDDKDQVPGELHGWEIRPVPESFEYHFVYTSDKAG